MKQSVAFPAASGIGYLIPKTDLCISSKQAQVLALLKVRMKDRTEKKHETKTKQLRRSKLGILQAQS
jgi:hypothetical protein